MGIFVSRSLVVPRDCPPGEFTKWLHYERYRWAGVNQAQRTANEVLGYMDSSGLAFCNPPADGRYWPDTFTYREMTNAKN